MLSLPVSTEPILVAAPLPTQSLWPKLAAACASGLILLLVITLACNFRKHKRGGSFEPTSTPPADEEALLHEHPTYDTIELPPFPASVLHPEAVLAQHPHGQSVPPFYSNLHSPPPPTTLVTTDHNMPAPAPVPPGTWASSIQNFDDDGETYAASVSTGTVTEPWPRIPPPRSDISTYDGRRASGAWRLDVGSVYEPSIVTDNDGARRAR